MCSQLQQQEQDIRVWKCWHLILFSLPIGSRVLWGSTHLISRSTPKKNTILFGNDFVQYFFEFHFSPHSSQCDYTFITCHHHLWFCYYSWRIKNCSNNSTRQVQRLKNRVFSYFQRWDDRKMKWSKRKVSLDHDGLYFNSRDNRSKMTKTGRTSKLSGSHMSHFSREPMWMISMNQRINITNWPNRESRERISRKKDSSDHPASPKLDKMLACPTT